MKTLNTLIKAHRREREIRSLRQGAEELKLTKLTVITLDTEETIREAGAKIQVVPCQKWLAKNGYGIKSKFEEDGYFFS